MFKFLSQLFDSNEKQLKKAQPIIDQTNSFEEEYSQLSDDELREKTSILQKQVQKAIQEDPDNTEKEKEILRKVFPEAAAIVREMAWRVAKHKHYDVQVLAAYFLFENNVIELFTGEGKTLAANITLLLYALTGRGAHLVTVNDYLAKRDAEWNGLILNELGLTVGAVNNDTQYRCVSDEEARKLKPEVAPKLIQERDKKNKKADRLKYDFMNGANLIECTKKEAYGCDVVYGTANEFGFDYLRDNMVHDIDHKVQTDLHFVIIDEADSILIDEARTPLIISRSASDSNDLYSKFAQVVRQLQEEVDYTVDEKAHAVVLSDDGVDRVEKLLNVKNVYEDASFAYHLENALKAKELFHGDDEYIVRDGQILIVDQFTGRVMEGRRYSEGLHQAIEAKEGVMVKKESKTIATITLQNYFRMYKFSSGMTATALTEAEEFSNIYGLDVVVVPTNKPVIRKDHADVVFRTQDGKFRAIIEDVKEHYEAGQPVLVGTTSVENSEVLSKMLFKDGVKHNVLNAKQHEREAKTIAEAGQKGAITIATNMAGRGTDISLEEGVEEMGGLYVIGSERHESRRIDNQLRGRSGRRGEQGESRFYVSFSDDLMRLFGGDSMAAIMGRVGMEDDMPVAAAILGRTIETAQKRVEAYHYDIRKRLVEYDDVLNQQREIIYGMRRQLLRLAKQAKTEATADKDAGLTGSAGSPQGGVTVDINDINDLDVSGILEGLNQFSLTDPDTYNLPALEHFPMITPTYISVFQKVVGHVKFLLATQLSDDKKIDNSEERKLVAQLNGLFTEELVDIASRMLGYEDSLGLFKEFDKESVVVKKEELILKLAIVAFIFHTTVINESGAVDIGTSLVLQTIDQFWMEHLDTMADLREGISLRNLANRDPLVEYKNEGFSLFERMLADIDHTIVNRFYKVRMVKRVESPQITQGAEVKRSAKSAYEDKKKGSAEKASQAPIGNNRKVGRNDPCPCGSGKKYKKCCYPKFE